MLLSRSGLFGPILAAAVVVAMAPAALAFSPPAKDTGAAAAQQPSDDAGDPLLAGANLERGKVVFDRIGNCISCHGWDGNGMGKNPRSEGNAALLRNSQLDTQGLFDIISCGIPGTPMPFHMSQAYKKPEVCFDQVMDDFEPGAQPRKGKTFAHKDLVNLVAYLQTKVIGQGDTTLAQCEEFFGAGAKNCDPLR